MTPPPHPTTPKLGKAQVPNAAYQVSRSSAIRFLRRNFQRLSLCKCAAAILVMWPRPYEQTFIPPSYGESLCDLVSISPAVLEQISFENAENTDPDNGPLSILQVPLWLWWAKKKDGRLILQYFKTPTTAFYLLTLCKIISLFFPKNWVLITLQISKFNEYLPYVQYFCLLKLSNQTC